MVRQIASPRSGWRAHDVPLFGVQNAAFEEHGIGDADLADVVQIAAAKQRRQVGLRKAHGLAQHDGSDSQPLAMPAGMRIAMLDGLRQREQNGLGFFERIDQRLVAKHGADARAHHRRMQRLDEKFVGAG